MNTVKLLKNIFKTSLVTLVVALLSIGGLVFNAKQAAAQAASPNMTARLLVNSDNDNPDAGWQHTLSSEAGHRTSFTLEIHNTVTGTEATDVRARVAFPSGDKNTLNIAAFATASNASTASDNVTINVASPVSGASIRFVPHSTRLYWDTNGDGVREYNNTVLLDGISDGGIDLGNQKGCNPYIIQITFMAELVGAAVQPTPTPVPGATPSPVVSPTPTPTPVPGASPSPTPTPVATPVATPTPPTGGQTQTQTQTQNNNQTVNITNSTPAAVVTTGLKEAPKTGSGVLGIATLFGAAPFGIALSRYGRGRIFAKREEKSLEEIANEAFTKRNVR